MNQNIMLKICQFIGHQRYLPFGLRDRILRKVFPIDAKTKYPFVSDFFGKKYRGDLNSYIDWSVFFYGAFEYHNLLVYKYLCENISQPIIVDIGANVGHHSLFFSTFASVVHAFEPYEGVRRRLNEKVYDNGLQKKVIVHPVGLGNKLEDLPFYAPEKMQANKGTGSFIKEYNTLLEEVGELRIVVGDDYFDQLKLSKIDLIKIDVEGFEKEVLMGMKNTLIKCRPIILMEFSEFTKNKIGTLQNLKILLPAQYQIKLIKTINQEKCLFKDFDFDFDYNTDIICLPC